MHALSVIRENRHDLLILCKEKLLITKIKRSRFAEML